MLRGQEKHGAEFTWLMFHWALGLRNFFFTCFCLRGGRGKSSVELARLNHLFRVGLSPLFDEIVLSESPVRFSQFSIWAVATGEILMVPHGFLLEFCFWSCRLGGLRGGQMA